MGQVIFGRVRRLGGDHDCSSTSAHADRVLSSFRFVICYSLFVISVSLSAGELRGTVVDPDGRRVANAELIVSGSTAAPLRARTDADGRFDARESSSPGAITVYRHRAGPGQRCAVASIVTAATPAIARHRAASQRAQRNAGRVGGADRSAAVAHARQRHGDSRRARSTRSSNSRSASALRSRARA